MAFSDFLSDGAPIPAGTAPINKTSTTTLPDWYTNYAMDLLSKQSLASASPYPTYTAPRVAGLTPDQQAAMSQTRSASTLAQPAIGTAMDQTKSLWGQSGLTAAQPYLSAASGSSVDNISKYMNPYTSSVVDRIAELGGRNFREQFLPALTDRFIGAGQGVGGTRQAELIGRGIRDLGESTLAEQAKALQGGYNTALDAASGDLNRQGQLASTAGQLGTSAVTSGLSVADQLAKLGVTGQETALAGAGALNTIGGQQQQLNQQNLTLAYQDFLKQQGWPQEMIDKALATMTGVGGSGAVPKSVSETGIQPTTYAPQYEPSTLANISGALTGTAGALSLLKDLNWV